MLQYVNGFSCAMDSEKDELIIKLLQRLLEGLKEMLEDEVV